MMVSVREFIKREYDQEIRQILSLMIKFGMKWMEFNMIKWSKL